MPWKESEYEVKYKSYLNYLNWLLKKINKEEIKKPEEFDKINRKDIMDLDVEKLHDEWYPIVYPTFSKTKLKYARRNQVQSYFITLLKLMSKDCGYKFICCQKQVQSNDIRKTITFYKIINV